MHEGGKAYFLHTYIFFTQTVEVHLLIVLYLYTRFTKVLLAARAINSFIKYYVSGGPLRAYVTRCQHPVPVNKVDLLVSLFRRS